MIFQGVEDPLKKDQKLSFIEKSLIIAAIPLAKMILRKVRRAKTYGDLMSIVEFFDTKMDNLENKYGETYEIDSDAAANTLVSEIEEMTTELERN